MRRKAFDSTLSNRAVCVEPPHTWHATIILDKPKHQPLIVTKRQLQNYSPVILCNTLWWETNSLRPILDTDNIDVQTNILTNTFRSWLDLCAPMVSAKLRRPHAPFLTDEILQLMNKRNGKQRNLKQDRLNSNLQQEYKAQKRQVKTMMSTDRKEYYNKEFNLSKGNTGAVWRLIRDTVPSIKRLAMVTILKATKSKSSTISLLMKVRKLSKIPPKLRKTSLSSITNTPAAKIPSVHNPSTPTQPYLH